MVDILDLIWLTWIEKVKTITNNDLFVIEKPFLKIYPGYCEIFTMSKFADFSISFCIGIINNY